MHHQVSDNKERHRFELEADGYIAFSEYKRSPGLITITHTEVPKELGGRGIGTALAHGLMEMIRAEGVKVKPLCPFVKAYIDKHPEYADLVA
ncbi:MAG: N-acetyltransferase [Proteobacteria bacterium]|nr:N-acetyltransferase [Pseudomonadota bacterium]